MTTSDAAFASLAEEVKRAREALLELVASERDRAWHPYELKTRARNGGSASAMSLALDGLVADGELVVDSDLMVSLPAQ